MEGTWKTVCPEDKGLWGGLGLARDKTDLCQIGCITLWPFCHGIPSAKIVQITLVDNKSVDDSLTVLLRVTLIPCPCQEVSVCEPLCHLLPLPRLGISDLYKCNIPES